MLLFPLTVKKSHCNLLFQNLLGANSKEEKSSFNTNCEKFLSSGLIDSKNINSVSKKLPIFNIKPISPLRGGGKKHKKKVYTKPKKTKHISKKTKLRILSYFAVSKGKIQRLRRKSPEAPGCFMADHSNRVTCGKTGLTFVRTN
mmetsp:Transcript_69265/g.144409  ORF Transcript_69265/g.144409 Transcript_69265/m.144409 type:complete len:144 (-) Transcript_69265:1658-2089(-)